MISSKTGLDLPEELGRAITGNQAREAHWARARPSCQARYIGYVAEAKKPETIARRVASVLTQMAAFYERHQAAGAD